MYFFYSGFYLLVFAKNRQTDRQTGKKYDMRQRSLLCYGYAVYVLIIRLSGHPTDLV